VHTTWRGHVVCKSGVRGIAQESVSDHSQDVPLTPLLHTTLSSPGTYAHRLCVWSLDPLHHPAVRWSSSDPILYPVSMDDRAEGTTRRTIRVPEPRRSQQVAPTTLIRVRTACPRSMHELMLTFPLALTSLVSSLLNTLYSNHL